VQRAEVLDPTAAEAEQRPGDDQAEDRDPLHGIPGVHHLALAELRPLLWYQQVDRHRSWVDLRQLEGHLDSLLGALAEVEDAADAGLEARLLDGLDGPQPAVVANRARHLGVVGAGRLDVVVNALDARLLQRPG